VLLARTIAPGEKNMSVQTTVSATPPIGAPGQLYDSGVFHDIPTFIATGPIPFGAMVKLSGQYCAVPTVIGDMAGKIGVAVKDPSLPSPYTGFVGGYVAGDLVPVLQTGRVWVATETALTDQAVPFVRYAAGSGGSQAGSYRNTTDTTTAAQPASGVHVYRGVAAAGLAVLELGKTGD
jgi:hypothetical protein